MHIEIVAASSDDIDTLIASAIPAGRCTCGLTIIMIIWVRSKKPRPIPTGTAGDANTYIQTRSTLLSERFGASN